MKVDAAILTGGRARRLGGVDKALLEVSGKTILARELMALGDVVGEVLLVGPDLYGHFGVRQVADRILGMGPLGGLAAALSASRAEALLLVGCDLPFLDPRLLGLVRDHAPAADAVVPRVAGRPQPLHARYARRILPHVEARLARGALRLTELLEELDVAWLEEPALRALDPTLRGLTNVNTPEALMAARLVADR